MNQGMILQNWNSGYSRIGIHIASQSTWNSSRRMQGLHIAMPTSKKDLMLYLDALVGLRIQGFTDEPITKTMVPNVTKSYSV